MKDISLVLYRDEKDTVINLIMGFWKVHSNYDQSVEEALEDLQAWTKEGHKLYLIMKVDSYIGFVHLGNRGSNIDWLEDIFIMPDYQNQGIGAHVIGIIEDMVKEYSESIYIEAAARNEGAIRLYRKLGYNCLNTITVRKDFDESKFDVVRTEKVYDLDFEIRKVK